MSLSAAVTSGCLNLKKFKGTTKTSACNFEKTVKNSERNGQLSVLKTKPIHSAQQTNDTNPKKERKGQTSSGKKDSSEDIFHISFNHSQRNGKTLREKYWKDMPINLSENKTTATEAMMQKSSIYLLGTSNHIFNFIFKILQHPVVASFC